jgi:hypothetical protein
LIKIIFFFFFSISIFSQPAEENDSTLFSQMLALHHDEFQAKSEFDFNQGNHNSTDNYFDSLVSLKLKGSILDNFRVYSINNKINRMYDLKKPSYLMSYASWCVPSNGETEALKQLIDTHGDWMDFVLIMWDTRKDAILFSKQFHPKIKVLYVNELYNTETKTIKMLKHKLGLPISITLSQDKTILNIRKNKQVYLSVDVEIATKICLEAIEKDILDLKNYENL